jgi:RNA ligase
MFTLAEAMKALEGREEFAVKKKDGLTVINYLITLPDSFVGIRENFRGVVFDDATGEIVSLPLHKFYNVNQKEHTQIGLIGEQECRVLEKFDGTMCHALKVGDQIVLASRMGWDSSQAIAATKLMSRLPRLSAGVAREVNEGRTPIFEYVGPNNPVVLHYKTEDLVYLWSRDRKTGEYTRNEEIMKTQSSPTERRMLIKDVMAEVAVLKDKEGFVCVLPGMWVKAKCPWYLDRHQAFDMLMTVQVPALRGRVAREAGRPDRAVCGPVQAEVGEDFG